MDEFMDFSNTKREPENNKSYDKRLYISETIKDIKEKKKLEEKDMDDFKIQDSINSHKEKTQNKQKIIDKMNLFKTMLEAEKVSEDDVLFAGGKYYYEKKDFEKASASFTKYIESFGTSAESEIDHATEEKKIIGQAYLAFSFFELEKWESCVDCLQEIMGKLPETEGIIFTHVNYYDLCAILSVYLGVALCKNGDSEQGLSKLIGVFSQEASFDIKFFAYKNYYFYSEKDENTALALLYLWVLRRDIEEEVINSSNVDKLDYSGKGISKRLNEYNKQILNSVPDTSHWRECMGNLFFLFGDRCVATDLLCDLIPNTEITIEMFKKAFNYALYMNGGFLFNNGIDSKTIDKVANGYLDLAFFYGEKLKETDDYPEISLKYETALLKHLIKDVDKAKMFGERLSLKMPEYDKSIQDKAILAETYRMLAVVNYDAGEKKNTKEYANEALLLFKGLEPQSDYYWNIAWSYLCLGWAIADEEPVQAENYYREALFLLNHKDRIQGSHEEVLISWIVSELEEIYETLGCKSLKNYFKNKQKESSYYYTGEYANDLLKKAIRLKNKDNIRNKQEIKDALLEVIKIEYHIGIEKLSEKEVFQLNLAYDTLLELVASDGDFEETNRIADEAMAHIKNIDCHSNTYYYKGWALFRMKDFSGAREYLEEALESARNRECSNIEKCYEFYRCNSLLSAMDAKEEKYEDALRSKTEAIRNYELYIHEIDKEDTEHISKLLEEVSDAVDILKKIDANDSRMEEFLNKKNKLMADLKVLASDNT